MIIGTVLGRHDDKREWDFHGANEEGGEVALLNKTKNWYDLVDDGAKSGSPRGDFRHFSGRRKQWQFPATADISYDESTDFKTSCVIQHLMRALMFKSSFIC